MVARRWSSGCSARAPRCSTAFPARRWPGPRYEPPFDYITDYGPRGHTVLEADFVTTDDGTGLVHTAIAFGEDDFRLGEQYGITLQNPVRAGRHLRRADHRLRGPLRQGRRPRHRRGAARARPAAARRALRALLPALLALRHAAPLLREVELVHPHHRRPRPDAGRERDDRLAPRAHQARPVRQVARGQRRLGALARALLGHAAADLGVRSPTTARSASAPARSPTCASAAARCPTTSTAPTSTRSSLRCEACGGEMRRVARGDRRLVRLGLDAVRAVPLPVRGRGGVHRALPGRLHLRGDRPDARLVLLAARGLDAGLRPHQLPQLRLPRA